jgi:hypothetical protein
MEFHVFREGLQNPTKAAKEERRLQEPDAEIRRQFGQVAGILMNALIRVGSDLACINKAEGARRL